MAMTAKDEDIAVTAPSHPLEALVGVVSVAYVQVEHARHADAPLQLHRLGAPGYQHQILRIDLLDGVADNDDKARVGENVMDPQRCFERGHVLVAVAASEGVRA